MLYSDYLYLLLARLCLPAWYLKLSLCLFRLYVYFIIKWFFCICCILSSVLGFTSPRDVFSLAVWFIARSEEELVETSTNENQMFSASQLGSQIAV